MYKLVLARAMAVSLLPLLTIVHTAFGYSASSSSSRAELSSLLLGFKYPDSLCGTGWRDEYVQLHREIRQTSREAAARRAAAASAPAPAPAGAGMPLTAAAVAASTAGAGAGGGAEAAATITPSIRFFTFEWFLFCGGLGDTLLGLVSSFIAAVLDKRAFIINHKCIPIGFESAGFIDWRPSEDVPMEINRTALAREKENVTDEGVLRLDLINNMMPIEGLAKFSRSKNLRVRWNRGRLIHLFQKGQGPWADAFRQVGLRPPYAVGCILRFLSRPKQEVWEQLKGMEREVRGEGIVTIGVHIRIPDAMVWESGEGDPKPLNATEMAAIEAIAQPMLECAQAVQDWWYPSSVEVRWLIVSNSAQLKSSLKAKYPTKVVVSPILPRHSNRFADHAAGLHFQDMPEYSNITSLKDAYEQFAVDSYRQLVADWLLLASSHIFVIPESGFSRTAVLYSFSTMKVYVPQNGTACDPKAPKQLTYMAGTWSGV